MAHRPSGSLHLPLPYVMPNDSPSPNFEQQVKTLRAENAQLKGQLRDLEVVIQIMADHGSFIEAELQTANKRLQLEIRERQQAEARLKMLVAAISQRNFDLEIILDTLREHGDAIHDQWYAKVKEANHIAGVDSLTQIPNRRRFDEYLAEQWPLMTDQQSPISLILADIDYFKQYNDTYGHLLGDSCLTYVAQALQNSVSRPTDLVSRYGGEEFAVILPDTDLSGALTIANRMQAAVAQLQLPHASSQVSHYITLSLGVVSVVPTVDQASHRLVASTDRQLYRAKQAGRNQIMSGNSLDPEEAAPKNPSSDQPSDGGSADEADTDPEDLFHHTHTQV